MSWGIERDGNVVIVEMAGTKANVQNDVFFENLHAAFDRLERDFADCAVVLTARGSCFSAGLDFDSVFPIFASGDTVAMADWLRRYQATNLRLWRFARPTVAAINGHAYAGGLLTALTCDYRIAADGARFRMNEVPIGIAVPGVFVEIIRCAIGQRAAALMTLFGREYDAQQAHRLGLVDDVTGPEGLLPAAVGIARAIEPNAFEAYAATKRSLQAAALERIETVAARMDEELPALFSSKASIQGRAARYSEVRGHAPSWAEGRIRPDG